MADSIISAFQARYASLTSFTGKPPVLWPGFIRLKNPDGSAVNYPAIRFTNDKVDWQSTFEDRLIETWFFTFEVYATSVQQALTIYDRVLFNGLAPSAAGGGGGFYKAGTFPDLPNNYVFMDLEPDGSYRVNEVLAEWTGEAVPVVVLSWNMALTVQRVAFAAT